MFGLGVIAQKSAPGQEFKAQLGHICVAIKWVYGQNFKSEDGDRSTCTENAIGAFGKCILFHGADPMFEENVVVEGYLNLLPLTFDCEEAQPVHLLFLQQIKAQNPWLAKCQDATKAALARLAEAVKGKHAADELVDDEGMQLLNQLA